MKISLDKIGRFFRGLFGRKKVMYFFHIKEEGILEAVSIESLKDDDFERTIERLEDSRGEERLGLSAEGWTFIVLLLVDGIKFVREKLFKDGKYQKPNIWKKIALGGYFVTFIFKLIIHFKK